MKKYKRPRPSLFDRFCDKFGPSIMKVCHFIDKQTHGFFEGLACLLTGGAYQPQPYKEPEEIKKECEDYTCYFSYNPRKPISGSITKDFQSVLGDFRSVCRDTSKAVQRMEREDPKVAKIMQEAKNSPQFQEQMQKVQDKIADVQRQCQKVRTVCSHSTTVASGNSSEHIRQ